MRTNGEYSLSAQKNAVIVPYGDVKSDNYPSPLFLKIPDIYFCGTVFPFRYLVDGSVPANCVFSAMPGKCAVRLADA